MLRQLYYQKAFYMPIIYVLFCVDLWAQTENKEEKRFTFAKSYFGIDMSYVPAYGPSSYLLGSSTKNYQRQGYSLAAVNIGATHFWGITDIYVSIPTVAVVTEDKPTKTRVSHGASTGCRVFPLTFFERIRNKSLHLPQLFVGYKFLPMTYMQGDHSHTKVLGFIDLGLSTQINSWYLYARADLALSRYRFDVYLKETSPIETHMPFSWFSVGANWMIETTKGAASDRNKKRHEINSQTNRYGFFLGVGPSAAFPISSSTYIKKKRPFLDDKAFPSIFFELSLGYNFSVQDIVIQFAFRSMKQPRKFGDISSSLGRKSWVLEGFKSLFDYHGFVPFIGAGASIEWLRFSEKKNNKSIHNIQDTQIVPSIVYGWDIRPAQKGDKWILRTTLRYTPFLRLEVKDGDYLVLNYNEFNFIQFIYYPFR